MYNNEEKSRYYQRKYIYIWPKKWELSFSVMCNIFKHTRSATEKYLLFFIWPPFQNKNFWCRFLYTSEKIYNADCFEIVVQIYLSIKEISCLYIYMSVSWIWLEKFVACTGLQIWIQTDEDGSECRWTSILDNLLFHIKKIN